MKLKLCALVVLGSVSVDLSAQVTSRYELVRLGRQVNTAYHEAAPVISPDGRDLYFFVSNHPNNTYGKNNSQDIWVTHKDEKGTWTEAKRLASPLNQHVNNQVFSVLPDGSIFIRGGRAKNDIKTFSVVSPKGGWIEIRVESFETLCQGLFFGAALSADARHMVLYFSETPGGVKSDLYISHENGGVWSRPEKLSFSSPGDDFGVFIAPDDKSIFFASDRNVPGHQGSSDIYKVERLDEAWTKFSEPVNMGRPINTAAGDAYFTIDAAGNIFSSRANSRVDGGNLDLYMLVPRAVKVNLNGIVVNEKTAQPLQSKVTVAVRNGKPIVIKTGVTGKFEIRIPETDQYSVSVAADNFLPRELTFSLPALRGDTTVSHQIALAPVAKKMVLAGATYNQKTKHAIPVNLQVIHTQDRNLSYQIRTGDNGQFRQELQKPGWYYLNGSAEGFLNATDSIWASDDTEEPLIKDLYLQPLEVGVTVRLKHIFFDFNKVTLKPESFIELNEVAGFLRRNPSVAIEIGGHTDNKGADDYNRNLSQGRSQSVVAYLVSQGISVKRLSAKGYGEAKPIDSNETDAGRANNRRVEFTVVKL